MRVTSRCAPTRAVNTCRVGFSALAAGTALVTTASLSVIPAHAEDAQTVTIGAILPITGLASTLGPVERDR